MAILKIARMGHPVLATPARPVDDPTAPEVRRLLDDMVETLRDAGGVGLAAPQVHVPWRVIIYAVPAARNAGVGIPLRILFNPEVEPLDDTMTDAREACLSLPGLSGSVPRFRHVRWRAEGADGRAFEGEATDFHARVLQHECDHLDGVLYPMRMRDLRTFGFVDALGAEAAPAPAPPPPPPD